MATWLPPKEGLMRGMNAEAKLQVNARTSTTAGTSGKARRGGTIFSKCGGKCFQGGGDSSARPLGLLLLAACPRTSSSVLSGLSNPIPQRERESGLQDKPRQASC